VANTPKIAGLNLIAGTGIKKKAKKVLRQPGHRVS
jgi:hypothetical protein